jgi:hypothetical protein
MDINLTNLANLAIDAQSALRRCIENRNKEKMK